MKKKPEPTFPTIAKATKGASMAGWHNISSMFRCPKEYQLGQIRGIRKPMTLQPDPLAIGSLFHEGRAHWFQSNFPTGAAYWAKLKDYVNESADTSNPPVRVDAINRTLSYLEQYCTHWALRAKPEVKLVETEVGPAPLKPDDPFFLYRTFRPDDISHYPEANMKLCIGELKTTSVGVDDAVNEYTLHGQPLMQWLVWAMAKNGEAKYGKVFYVMLDVVVKGYGKDKCTFGRQAIPITDYSLVWYANSMRHFLKQAQSIEYDTEVPRVITSCTRLIGRARVPCTFRDLCQFGKPAAIQYVDSKGDGLNHEKYKDKKVKPWE